MLAFSGAGRRSIALAWLPLAVFPVLALLLSANAQAQGFRTMPEGFNSVSEDADKRVASSSFPWHVALQFGQSQALFFCGGVVIDARWVLTTAHCAQGMQRDEVVVSYGTELLSAGEQFARVEEIHLHPGFGADRASLEDDIALLFLDSAVPSPYASLIRSRDDEFLASAGTIGLVIGWGATRLAGAIHDSMQQLSFQIVSRSSCNGPAAYAGAVAENMLCAYSLEEEEDVCEGFGGSPLVVADYGGTYRVGGLVSWGDRCGLGSATVFTMVSRYMTWIDATMSSNR